MTNAEARWLIAIVTIVGGTAVLVQIHPLLAVAGCIAAALVMLFCQRRS